MNYIDIPIVPEQYYVAAMTDRYLVGVWNNEISLDEDKLLELRIFNKKEEHKWFRGNIGEDMAYRYLSDDEAVGENSLYEEPIEEYQLLDVDTKRSEGILTPGYIHTTKGGVFYLPQNININSVPCVIVKYYVPKYNSDDATTIHSYVKDWRLAGFEPRKEGM